MSDKTGKNAGFGKVGIGWIAASVVTALAVLFFSYASQQGDAGNWFGGKGAFLFPFSHDLDSVEEEIKRLKASLKTAQLQKAESDALKKEYNARKTIFWDTDRDGEPESKLRSLIGDTAKRAEANIRTIGSPKVIPVSDDLSCVDIDFTLIDDYSKIIRFFSEVAKCTPHLFWRRIELRMAPARIAPDKPGTVYMTGLVRVYKSTLKAQSGAVDAADGPAIADRSSTTNEKTTGGRSRRYSEMVRERDELTAEVKRLKRELKSDEKILAEMRKNEKFFASDPDFLFKLYTLSLALPEDMLATNLRFNEGICELAIQTANRTIDPAQRLRFPFWTIVRIQKRVISDSLFSFTITFRAAEAKPMSDVSPDPLSEEQIATTVAQNIFDPKRIPDTAANRGMTAARKEDGKESMTLVGTSFVGDTAAAVILLHDPQSRPGSNGTGTNDAERSAAELEQLLQQAVVDRDELDSLLQTLQQTPGITDEQIELLRRRVEHSEQQINLIEEQLKKIKSVATSAGETAATDSSGSNRLFVRIGETLPNGFKLEEVSATSAILSRGSERIELKLLSPSEAENSARQHQER